MSSVTAPSPPSALSKWFFAHCVIDVIFAIPLMIAPSRFLALLEWPAVDPLFTRLVAAALFAIGIESFLGRHGTWESFRGMLNLKIIWSAMATLGIALSLGAIRSPAAWGGLVIFGGFHVVWVYWRVVLSRIAPRETD